MPRKDLKDPLPPPNSVDLDSSGESTASGPSVNLLDSNNRNIFLTKVGITFMLYSLACFCTAIFILIDIRRTTIVYRQWSLQTVLWVFLIVSTFIKFAFGFFGQHFRKLAKVFFPVDLFATVMFVLGVYYYLDSYKTTTNYSYAPFVVICCVNLFVSSFFFTLATLYHSRSKEFNYIIGTLLMTFFNVVATLGLAFGWKEVVTITPWQYTIVGVGFAVFNLYVSVNSYYIINVRVDKFTESDAVWAFYCYWTDWVFVFWKNLFENTSRIIRAKRRLRKKNAEAKAKAKASQQADLPRKSSPPAPPSSVPGAGLDEKKDRRESRRPEGPLNTGRKTQQLEVKIV